MVRSQVSCASAAGHKAWLLRLVISRGSTRRETHEERSTGCIDLVTRALYDTSIWMS